MRTFPLLLALAPILACARTDASTAHGLRAERDTVGDTIVVRTIAGSRWGLRRVMSPVVSIGKADGQPYEMLGNIHAIAVAPDGAIYISDGGPVLRKYDRTGRYLATFGREGAGPGEYAQPDGGLGVMSDGRVVLRDPGNGRLTIYDSSGTYLGSWRINAGFNTSNPLVIDVRDNLFTPVWINPDGPLAEVRSGLRRFASDGTPGDTLLVPHWDYQRQEVSASKEGSTSINDVPFTSRPIWAYSPQGYVVGALSGKYHVVLFRPARPVVIERKVDPVPVAPEEASERRRVMTANMRKYFPGWVWNGSDIPSSKPPLSALFAGQDGRIWVQLSQPGVRDPAASDEPSAGGWYSDTWSEPVVFDVFEADGTYLGQVRAPDGFLTYPRPVFRGDTAWGVTEDADGVRYVSRFALVPDSAGAARE